MIEFNQIYQSNQSSLHVQKLDKLPVWICLKLYVSENVWNCHFVLTIIVESSLYGICCSSSIPAAITTSCLHVIAHGVSTLSYGTLGSTILKIHCSLEIHSVSITSAWFLSDTFCTRSIKIAIHFTPVMCLPSSSVPAWTTRYWTLNFVDAPYNKYQNNR